MYNKNQIVSELKKQLAIDFNCTPEDFGRKENIITINRDNPGRRVYVPHKEFFSMVTLGSNAVISANASMHEWIAKWSDGKEGVWLFEHNHLMELENELQKYGKKLWQSHHMFLPEPEFCNPVVDFSIKWFEQEEIMNLYGREEFSNALCDRYIPERPDVLAVGAMKGDYIIGLAGCSADTKLFWQLGIDVLPEYRGVGIGTKLIMLLKDEVFRRGAIPFYGTSLSNLHSWNIAINSGFYPAWVEIETVGENEESIIVIEKELEKSLDAINIPETVQKRIGTTEYKTDIIGMSESSVLLFDDKVLKIEVDWYESENEYLVMEWLRGKLPVPEVVCREKKDGKSYFLMSKISGKMLCDEFYMTNPELVVDLLVEALHMFWQVDISDCPLDAGIDRKLKMAKYNLEHDNVDLDNVEPETFGEGGFENAEALFNWLIQNKPQEELVFTHGDFCLPNIFANDDKISGFIDLGRAGVADKYQDIAICYRSLKHNFEGKYGGEKYVNFNPDILFEKLGIIPDWNKIKYYTLLDELF